MKIEAKKTRFNVNKNQGNRPVKTAAEEPVREKPRRAASRWKLPAIKIPKIQLPKIKLPGISLPKIALPEARRPEPAYTDIRPAKAKISRPVLLIALLAVPLLALSAWLGVNLGKHGIPKPLFTERDLPALPPAESNGFTLIDDLRTVDEYSSKDLADGNLFRNAASMETHLDKTRGEYAFAKNLAAREDVKKMTGLYRDIITKPVFADTTMPDQRDSRKFRVYSALHNSITATMIALMQEKRHGAAFKMMKDQLDLNIRYIRSARSMAGYLGSMQSYEISLKILRSMLNQFGGDMKMGGDAVAACREIGALLQSFDPAGLSLSRIVMFEYILSWKQRFAPGIQHPEAGVYRRMKFRALAFFDRGLTQKMFDERWRAIHECAKNSTDDCIARINKTREQRFTSGRFWWFRNAVGKKYLDTITIPVYQLLPESKGRAASLNRIRGDIVGVINSFRDEPKQEKAPAKKRGGAPVKKRARG